MVFRRQDRYFHRWPPPERVPFDAEFDSAPNPSPISTNPSGIANPDEEYRPDGSWKAVFPGQDPLFNRWPPPESVPFDAEFNSAPNPSPISTNPSGIANPDEEYRPDGSWKAVFPGQDPLFNRWPPPESVPFDAEFNSAPNPSPISTNPSGIANPDEEYRPDGSWKAVFPGQDPLFNRWPPPESVPFDAEFNSAPNPSPISTNPSGIANPDEEYRPDGSWKAVFPGQDPLFNRWPPPESVPFDAEFNSAPNPSPISTNPSGIANPDEEYRPDGSWKAVFPGQDPLFNRWPPPESVPFDAEFNSAPNPSPISTNPSGIANPDEEYRPDGSWKAVFPGQDPLFNRSPPPESVPFDAEFNSAPNPSPISTNPSGIANPDEEYRPDGSWKAVFPGQDPLFNRSPPPESVPFDAEFNSAPNPSPISTNPSGIANPDEEYRPDGSWKAVFPGQDPLFNRWPPPESVPFDAEFNSAPNPSPISTNPSGIANPEEKGWIWC